MHAHNTEITNAVQIDMDSRGRSIKDTAYLLHMSTHRVVNPYLQTAIVASHAGKSHAANDDDKRLADYTRHSETVSFDALKHAIEHETEMNKREMTQQDGHLKTEEERIAAVAKTSASHEESKRLREVRVQERQAAKLERERLQREADAAELAHDTALDEEVEKARLSALRLIETEANFKKQQLIINRCKDFFHMLSSLHVKSESQKAQAHAVDVTQQAVSTLWKSLEKEFKSFIGSSANVAESLEVLCAEICKKIGDSPTDEPMKTDMLKWVMRLKHDHDGNKSGLTSAEAHAVATVAVPETYRATLSNILTKWKGAWAEGASTTQAGKTSEQQTVNPYLL